MDCDNTTLIVWVGFPEGTKKKEGQNIKDKKNSSLKATTVGTKRTVIFTWKTQGIPSTNSTKHMPAVNRTFLFLNRCGNSSMKALVMVSNMPNCTQQEKYN